VDMSTRIAVLLLAAISVRAQVGTGSITGVLEDARGTAIKGAPVILEHPDKSRELISTDEYGGYRVSNLSDGDYTLTLGFPPFLAATLKVKLAAGEKRVLPPVQLEPAKSCNFDPHPVYFRSLAPEDPLGSLTGTIKQTHEENSPPVVSASVTLHCSEGGNCDRSTITDSSGFFAFEQLTPGTYDLRLTAVLANTSGYKVNAGMETSYSFGAQLTAEEEKWGQKITVNGQSQTVFVCE